MLITIWTPSFVTGSDEIRRDNHADVLSTNVALLWWNIKCMRLFRLKPNLKLEVLTVWQVLAAIL